MAVLYKLIFFKTSHRTSISIHDHAKNKNLKTDFH